MPVPLPQRLAGGKTYNRFGQLLVITDLELRLIAVGVVGKDNQTVNVTMVGEEPETMVLRARWEGIPPRPGDYLMAKVRPKSAYRVIERRATGSTNEYTRLDIRVVRVDVADVPPGATIHPWKWDPRGKNAGHVAPSAVKVSRALVPRHLEILRKLVAIGDWAKPADLGGKSCTFHYASLTRLVKRDLVERRERRRDTKLPPDRRSYEYRVTPLGAEHAK